MKESPSKKAKPIKGTGEPDSTDAVLREFSFTVLDFVVSVLDAESDTFRAHAQTVAKYSRIVAERLKLSLSEINQIVLAAYLHDFHKLIDNKKRTYNITEILASLGAPEGLEEIINHVHDRFDGKDAAGGLVGTSIPLGSRIIAVANMLDEISRGKVDTQVIRRDAALKSLRKRAGTYLDPEMVDCLTEALSSEYKGLFKENDARILVAVEKDDLRFQLANALMENGFTIRTKSDEQGTFEAVAEFSPHVLIVTIPLFKQLVELCGEHDIYIHKPVIVLQQKGIKAGIKSNDYVPVEDFVETPLNMPLLIDKLETVMDRVIKQEAKAREAAGFFEKAANNFKAGDIYREIGDYRKAAEMYEVANVYGFAGEMYELLKDYKKAAKAFEMAGDYVKAAKLYHEVGMYEDRGRVYEKTGDFYYTAKNKLHGGDTKAALEYFKRVDTSHEKYRKACYYLAKIYMEQRQWQQAIKCYDKVVAGEAVHRKNLRHYYNVAIAHEHLGQYPKALEIYEKILGVDYNFRDVHKRVEHLRRKVQKLEQRTKLEHKVSDFAAVDTVRTAKETRYEKIKVIGRGGMGVVYEATDRVLDRKVALKVLSAAFREDKFVVETFLREAKAAAMLNHVNIVTIYDAGIENNNYFIAMELIHGQTIKEIIRDKRFSFASILRIMRQVCSGLNYAHSKKVIHRDLTNANIMLTKDNIIKIMDFGLARIVEHLMSEQSIIGGTPSYMAPEQVRGAPIDQRADIYALGCNLFELAAGRLPFVEGDLGYHHVHTAPPNPQEINAKIPTSLSTVILKCLEKEPSDRYQSVAELMQALKIGIG